MKKILILNGPNLNLLGIRQTGIYGNQSLDELVSELKDSYRQVLITHCQSNHEGQIIDWLHKYGFSYDGIILNAGAYTHTSIAIADAISSIKSPVVEVHISDIMNREDFRKQNYLEDVCVHQIMGKGTVCYEMALQYLLESKGLDEHRI